MSGDMGDRCRGTWVTHDPRRENQCRLAAQERSKSSAFDVCTCHGPTPGQAASASPKCLVKPTASICSRPQSNKRYGWRQRASKNKKGTGRAAKGSYGVSPPCRKRPWDEANKTKNLNRTLFLRRSPFDIAVRFNRVITLIARLGIGARVRVGFRFSLALGLFVGLLFLLQLALPLFVRKIRFRHESPLFVV